MGQIVLIDAQTAGISGDMLLGALIDAGADPKRIQQVLDQIPLRYQKCQALQLQVRENSTHGFRARQVEFKIVEGTEEIQAAEFLRVAENIAKSGKISERASSFAIGSIQDLVTVESKVHGVSAYLTHLHEAGSSDTLGDVFGVATACDLLNVFDGEICSTPIAIGGGLVGFSHGTVAVPAPAVLEIVRSKNIPIHGGPENIELATPTGVAMLANLASNYVENYPPMIPKVIGYGAGKTELPKAPNVLRVVIGQKTEPELETDFIKLLETNLDDLPGELLGHTLEKVLASGARDAWVTSAQFKKNRPGHVLHVICDSTDAPRLAQIIMEETGSLGVRHQQWNRFIMKREIETLFVEIAGRRFNVHVKFARQKSGKIVNVKPEFDDVHNIANQLSMPARQVSEVVLREARKVIEQLNEQG